MRIWTLHPKYLDSKGLVALWREALLAKHVLRGKTRGYKNHPQLERFKSSPDPIQSINSYLSSVHKESVRRGYQFDPTKVDSSSNVEPMEVTKGQLEYEWNHLLIKLQARDINRFNLNSSIDTIEVHPLFRVVPGGVESWEVHTELDKS